MGNGRYSQGCPEARSEAWRAFDAMPPPLRHAVAHAPYEYHCGMVLDLWRGGEDILALCARLRRVRPKVCLAAYGPDHPEAQA
jgi:hypothetical protein